MFDLVLIFSVLVILLGLLGSLFALVTHRWTLLRRLILGIVIYDSVYTLLLVGVALLSPQQVLAMHELHCFDDWCVSVDRFEQQPAIGAAQAQGVFYLVTVKVTSQAKRVSQRALDAVVI
jgi:hypothetical protein